MVCYIYAGILCYIIISLNCYSKEDTKVFLPCICIEGEKVRFLWSSLYL